VAGSAEEGDGGAAFSQTLDRGLRVLEVLSQAARPLTVVEIAAAAGLHRSVAYRLVRTLERHQLVERDASGGHAPGVGLAALARSVRRTLQAAALPELTVLANALQMTAFIVVRDGADAVTIVSVEPRAAGAHVAYQPGTRHAVDRGAPGLALLMPDAPAVGDREALIEAVRAAGRSPRARSSPGSARSRCPCSALTPARQRGLRWCSSSPRRPRPAWLPSWRRRPTGSHVPCRDRDLRGKIKIIIPNERVLRLPASVFAVQELADSLPVRLAVIPAHQGLGHPHRVTEEVVLIQRLPPAEVRQRRVPGEPE